MLFSVLCYLFNIKLKLIRGAVKSRVDGVPSCSLISFVSSKATTRRQKCTAGFCRISDVEVKFWIWSSSQWLRLLKMLREVIIDRL